MALFSCLIENWSYWMKKCKIEKNKQSRIYRRENSAAVRSLALLSLRLLLCCSQVFVVCSRVKVDTYATASSSENFGERQKEGNERRQHMHGRVWAATGRCRALLRVVGTQLSLCHKQIYSLLSAYSIVLCETTTLITSTQQTLLQKHPKLIYRIRIFQVEGI